MPVSDKMICRKNNSRIAITSRIRLARNLAGHKFANAASREEMGEILRVCAEALGKTRKFKNGAFFNMSEISDISRELLFEDRAISRELAENTDFKAVFVSKDKNTSAMINEEDHLRIQTMSAGLSLGSIWRSINLLDDAIEEHLEFAFSSNYGYLTACPTNVGTGMRASVMLHLPALVMSEQMDKIVRGVNQLGMVVRGANGEGSDSYGAFFHLSNQQTLGISESNIVKKITRFAKRLSDFEVNARKKLGQDNPKFLEDKIERARAVLCACKLIDTAEATACLSHLRMAVDMGLFEGGDGLIDSIDGLILKIRPSHLQSEFKSFDSTASERDEMRARLLNREISALFGKKKLSK